MATVSIIFLLAATLPLVAFAANVSREDEANRIIAIERAALERWANGDPDGFLEVSDPQVVYFDPFLEKRLDGRDNLRKLYDTLRGKVKIDHWEMLNPKVRLSGNVAVLTFNYVSGGSDGTFHWNCTEVYEKGQGAWRIIHTHWSFTKPKLAT